MQRNGVQGLGVWVVAVTFGTLTMACIAALLVWTVVPGIFPTDAHRLLEAAPLALVAIALLTYQVATRPPWFELLKALIVAAAFLCWSANQLLPDIPQATLFNDLAIALFVLDVFLLIVSTPPVWPEDGDISARFTRGFRSATRSQNGASDPEASRRDTQKPPRGSFP